MLVGGLGGLHLEPSVLYFRPGKVLNKCLGRMDEDVFLDSC